MEDDFPTGAESCQWISMQTVTPFIGGSKNFFRGGLKDEFIRMCTDCYAWRPNCSGNFYNTHS